MARVTRFYQTTVRTSVTQIVAYSPERTALLIRNISGSTVYISTDQGSVHSEGLKLDEGEYVSMVRADGDAPELQVYAATASGTADLRIVETMERENK